jgi:predicted DNA-binding WGR domain protein
MSQPETPAPDTNEPAKPAATLPLPSATGSARRFEFVGDSSNKFWEMSLSGNTFTVRFGRIGTAGQSQTKTFADETKAKAEAQKLIAEKIKKGYVEKA